MAGPKFVSGDKLGGGNLTRLGDEGVCRAKKWLAGVECEWLVSLSGMSK